MSVSLWLFRTDGCDRVICVEASWNVMVHAQKPDFVFRRNGRVHLNWRGRQFSRVLTAEVCASAVVMLDTSCSEVVWEYGPPTQFASFPFTSPPVRHRVPSHFNWSLPPVAVRHWDRGFECHKGYGRIGLRRSCCPCQEPKVHQRNLTLHL